MESKRSKNIIIAVLVVCIIALITIIVLLVNKNVKINNKNTEIQETKESEKVDKINENLNLEDYKGVWYIDENSIGGNASFIEIKGVENNKVKANAYICRTTEFGDFEIEIDGNVGTFKIEGEQITGPSTDGKVERILGNVKFEDNKLRLTIVDTNVAYLEESYTFLYKSGTKQNIDMSKYKGVWYIDENSIGENASFIEIKGVENNKVKANAYICRTTEFGDFEIEIDGNVGLFEIEGEQITGPSTDGEVERILGNIKFEDNKLRLIIVDTNVAYLEKSYTFSYKV